MQPSSFALMVGLGASLGLFWVAWQTRKIEHMSRRQLEYRLNGSLVILMSALAGARLGYILINWGYYQSRPGEAIDISQGGFTWPGALIGALLALIVFARWSRLSIGGLADALVPLAASVVCAIWLANWQVGVAYGPATQAWWGIPSLDEWGNITPRFPVQLLGALLALVSFGILETLRPRLAHLGQTSSLGFLMLSAQLLGLSLLRADPAPLWRGNRLDSWIALIFLILSLVDTLVIFVPTIFQKEDETAETWTVSKRPGT